MEERGEDGGKCVCIGSSDSIILTYVYPLALYIRRIQIHLYLYCTCTIYIT